MSAKIQITLDPEMQRRAQARAAELKISFAEYMRRLLVQDLGEAKRKVDISAIFDLADGQPIDIAHDKDKMIARSTRLAGPNDGGKINVEFRSLRRAD